MSKDYEDIEDIDYESDYADTPVNFVIPPTYEADFETSEGYYNAVASCLSTAYQSVSALPNSASEIKNTFGDYKMTKWANAVDDINNFVDKLNDVQSTALADALVFSSLCDTAVEYLFQIVQYAKDNMPDYIDPDGNLILNSEEDMEKMLRAAVGDNELVDQAIALAKKEGRSVISVYLKQLVKDKLINTLTSAGIEITVDLIDGGFYTAVATALKQGIASLVSNYANATTEAAKNEALTGLKYISAGWEATALANIISLGVNIYVNTAVNGEDLLSEANVVACFNAAEAFAISLAVGAATGGVGLVPALVTTGLTFAANWLTTKAVHAFSYDDGISRWGHKDFDIEDYLDDTYDGLEKVCVNGYDCVPEIAIELLKSEGFDSEGAKMVLALDGGSENAMNSLTDNLTSEEIERYNYIRSAICFNGETWSMIKENEYFQNISSDELEKLENFYNAYDNYFYSYCNDSNNEIMIGFAGTTDYSGLYKASQKRYDSTS